MSVTLFNAAFLSLDPRFQPILKEILIQLQSKGYQPVVVEGRRTVAQQVDKVKQGNSTTMQSYHLSGCAADVCDVREMWNKGLVRPFWWDMYQIVHNLTVVHGAVLRSGIVWDHPERVAIYKQALDDLLAGKITQHQADARITWFADVAHTEVHFS